MQAVGRWLAGVLGSLLLGVPAAAVELQPVMSGLVSPVYLTHARDGSGRLFVVEQGGVIRMLGPGASIPTVFLDITARVLAGGERGLLGLAFHPQYRANGRLFVNYTRRPDGATVVAEYQVSADPDVARPETERILLTIAQPFANHNGGMIEFGPDAFLYIGTGDGGSANDPGNRAQNVDELLGKILRIDVDQAGAGLPYGIPPDNPFAGAGTGRPEIYALGLRNPFRFSFDRGTGRLLVGDVGQGAWEEIDIVTRGANLGWRVFEGHHCTGLDAALCAGGAFTPPIAEYAHAAGRCSVTGGYIYRGAGGVFVPGTYVFGDFCTGEIFALVNGAPTVLLDTTLNISAFGEDQTGEIYVVGLGGTVHRLAPSLTAAVLPLSRAVMVGTPATAFATMINASATTAPGCGLSLATPLAATFAYLTTDAATNALTGAPNTPVDILAGGSQSFVFAITPGGALAPSDVALGFHCANGEAAPVLPAVNTLQLSADTSPIPDVVALVALDPAAAGIVNIPGADGVGFFGIASVNVGATGVITVAADAPPALPLTLAICQSDAEARCLAPPGPSVTVPMEPGSTPSFVVFATGRGSIPFAPAANRIFVRFRDASGTVRGATSVAVRTQG
jgi:glucose/arabinose dehydrogenase